MFQHGSASAASDATSETFAEALDRLKARGCLVLVVGPVGDDAKYVGCRRLLGDELSRTRRRLFVTTDGSVTNHPGAKATCGHRAPADSRAVTYSTTARGATSVDVSPSMIEENEVVDGELSELVSSVEDAVSALESRAGGFEPSELRVCIDDLDAIIATADERSIVEFTRELRELVLENRGMCHVHLSRDVPGAPMDALVRYFDAVVEVESGERYRQRWHVRNTGITTDWLEL